MGQIPEFLCLSLAGNHPLSSKSWRFGFFLVFFLAHDKSRGFTAIYTITLLPFKLNCKTSPRFRRCWRRGAGPRSAEPGCRGLGATSAAASGASASSGALATHKAHSTAGVRTTNPYFGIMSYQTRVWTLHRGVGEGVKAATGHVGVQWHPLASGTRGAALPSRPH